MKHRSTKDNDVITGSVKNEVRPATKLFAVVIALVFVVIGSAGYVWWRGHRDQGDARARAVLHTIPQCQSESESQKPTCISSSVEAVTYRIYRTGLNRDPDHSGFTFWVNAIMNNTQTVNSLASAVAGNITITQAAGTTTTVPISDEAFVEQAYKNIIGRSSDPSGKAYWVNQLKTKAITRDYLIAFFAQTAGITKAQAVQRLGSTTTTVTNPSSQNNDELFITALYNNSLGRNPDSGGLNYWVGKLTSGQSYADVLLSFSSQAEVVQRLSSGFTTYVQQSPPDYTGSSAGNSGGNTGNTGGGSSGGSTTGNDSYVCNKPYPSSISIGTKDGSNNRTDKCVSAVQHALKYGAGQSMSVNGTVDAATVAGIRNIQRFFGWPVTGALTADQTSYVLEKLSGTPSSNGGGTTGGSGGTGGSTTGNTTATNPYTCNKPYPSIIKMGTRNTTNGRTDKCVSAMQYAFNVAAGQSLTVDGVVGALTVNAIRNYQRLFKQPVTGEMTAAQIEVLNTLLQMSSTSTTSASGSNSNAAIVEIAYQELNKRPVEYDSNVLKYTDGAREAWCADFVSWVFKQAGKPFTGGWSGGWRISYVPNIQSYANNRHWWHPASDRSFTPQPGDIIIYGSTHTNIVVNYNKSTDMLTTIGGNEGDKVNTSTFKRTGGRTPAGVPITGYVRRP